MIERTTIDGRPVTVAYITGDFKPALKGQHDMAKLIFDDGEITFVSPVRKVGDAASWDESKHPRGQPENKGQFGPGGGGSDIKRSGTSKPGATAAEALAAASARRQGKGPAAPAPGSTMGHKSNAPLTGYSKNATLKDGVIHTNDVNDAARALHENRRVNLDQAKSVSVLLDKLGEIAADMAKKGEKAPTIDLCNVTVEDTNLFCVETKGIPRIEMPQMDEVQTEKFKVHLVNQGYKVTQEEQFASYLRATQNELNGHKVAGIAKALREGTYKPPSTVVSADDYVLDGHHRWAAKVGNDSADGVLNNDTKMPVTRVHIDIIKLLEEAHKFTGGKGRRGVGDAVPWDESKHPRGQPENKGQFGPGGGGSSEPKSSPASKAGATASEVMASAAARAAGKEVEGPPQPTPEEIEKAKAESEKAMAEAALRAKLEPKAVDVGGDQWNQETAVRLETEYQEAKPKLDKLVSQVIGEEPVVPVDEEDEDQEPYPEEWDMLSSDVQSQIEESYYESTLDDYITNETDSWIDNGGQLDDTKSQLAGDLDWLGDTVRDWMAGDDNMAKPYPYTAEQIADAINLEYESDGEGTGKLKVGFVDQKLDDPIGGPDPAQQTLPGMGKEDLSKRLTSDMRLELKTMLMAEFDKYAEKNAYKTDPPEYLSEQAKEFQKDSWEEMGDDSKFEWAKSKTSIIDDIISDLEQGGSGVRADDPITEPAKYDPLNTTTGADYKNTQKLARALSIERAEQVLKERNLPYPGDAQMRRVDSALWSGWKGSSTGYEGQLLQVAVAEELGGRLNERTKVKIDAEFAKKEADRTYPGIGGYDGVKAYVRAKWETTQYLLDRAGIHDLELYRGIALEKSRYQEAEGGIEVVNGYSKAPKLKVVRNGAASTTTDPDVANGWSHEDTRVVLRAHVPRTAAVSVPAYGINVQSEHEVVIAGTAWKGWDAWLGKAPRFSTVKMAA